MVQVLNTGVQIINVNLVEQYMTPLWYLYWYYARSITATLIKAAIIPHCRASNCSVSFPFPNLRIFLYTLPGVSFLKHVIFFKIVPKWFYIRRIIKSEGFFSSTASSAPAHLSRVMRYCCSPSSRCCALHGAFASSALLPGLHRALFFPLLEACSGIVH